MKQRSERQKLDALVRELSPLRHLYPGKATPRWISWLAGVIWELEETGSPGFGGADILAWWLVQRAMPRERLTRAQGKRLVKMAGRSQKTLDQLISMAENRSAPSRMQRGWSFMQLNTYIAGLKADSSVRIWEVARG